MRIILFAGKGGVGKTSLSAATGVKSASLGYRTLVMSLDPAHSLSDSFDLDRGLLDKNKGMPIRVTDNLWIQELDVQEEVKRNWGEVHGYLSTLLNLSGLEEILAEELAILPGMEEVSSLLYINRYARLKRFDVILLDCAPTGESIRFISIPTALEWYMKKIFKLERQLARYARPIIKRVSTVPIPEDEYFQNLQRLFERLEGVDQLLSNPEITSVRLVTNPEKMVIKETQRAFLYFCLYKVCVDAIMINRIFPPGDIKDNYFDEWRKSQEIYINKIEEYFSPIPIFKTKLFRDEILGLRDLTALANEVYKDRDPTEIFYRESPYHFAKKDGRYHLIIKLPFISKKDIELGKAGDELIVRIGSFKRYVPLPRNVAAASPESARIDEQRLIISFGGKDERRDKKGSGDSDIVSDLCDV